MRKEELIELLQSLNIPVNEGITNEKKKNEYPRIVFWEYVWEDISASGEVYSTVETYQISFYALEARHEKLLELRQKLRERKIFNVIYHEYVKEDKIFHSYFSIETNV